MTATAHSPSPVRQLRHLALGVTLALLGACDTPGGGQRPDSGVATTVETTPGNWQVESERPISRYEMEFAAAEQALQQFDWMRAETALLPLSSLPLDAEDGARLAYLRARIAHVRGREDEALAGLAALEGQPISDPLAYSVYSLHREILSLVGRNLESARLGVPAMLLAPQPEREALKQDIWLALQRCDTTSIATALSTAEDRVWQGWLELALLSQIEQGDLGASLYDWETKYPAHPASYPLPGGLEQLQRDSRTPQRVALVLPLSGRLAPAGRAVRDGYLASYYAARATGAAPAQLLILDTERYPGASEAYLDAVAQGAQLVIGPLRKEAVAELDALPERPVPVLALNRIDTLPLEGAGPLLQLALAPEDEVRRLAELAFGEGARRALLLRPAGAWGDKLEETLVARWRELGGTVANSVRYTGAEEYSDAVKSGLDIAASEERRRRVRDMLASNVEFTPRRRQDIDAVFLLSPGPDEARALKPLLAFHYAGGLPAYAPSGVYGGQPDPRDRDLNGLRLVEIPWLLSEPSALHAALDAAGDTRYPRLNALGADAYLLQSRFAQVQAGDGAVLRGNTGLLTLNPAAQVERDLPLAEFDRGRLVPR
ncbi:penicillin-binding protein activator [Mangrovimicrobium sediminis]|nr:penicillin-binding protein activator [Haliea sp. SAOS-164]